MYKIVFIFLLSICCIRLNAQEIYKKAFKEFENSNYKKSVQLFKESIRKGEDTLNSHLYLAASNIYLYNYQEAIISLDIVKNIDSNKRKLHAYYGALHLLMGQYNKALQSYNTEISLYPNDYNSYVNRGIVRGLLRDSDGAMEDFNKAIIMFPSDHSIYTNRGYEYLKVKQYKKAMDDFNSSLKIEPNQKAYTNRGVLYFLIDSNTLAIKDYTNALKLVPNDGETLYLRGVSYKKINEIDKACNDFNRSLKLGYKWAKEMIDELHCK